MDLEPFCSLETIFTQGYAWPCPACLTFASENRRGMFKISVQDSVSRKAERRQQP